LGAAACEFDVAQKIMTHLRESAGKVTQDPCQCWQGREMVMYITKYDYTFLLVQSEDLISFLGQKVDILSSC
jgi:hypothetical protein